ncbi:hypothetical protein HPB51_025136 [Rhipicephalus microplus]|uniref:Uncharacterized protein n=1 Tax=Rhipicephalus microplus TaxID=6941 RepID=A0A9J6DQH2_RHIMP|nr:hypothetical protein HPB51_025136 [Rhipicephalus microplus]
MTNTYGELKEANLSKQYLRLTKSHAGRCLLRYLHMSYTYQAAEWTMITEDGRGALVSSLSLRTWLRRLTKAGELRGLQPCKDVMGPVSESSTWTRLALTTRGGSKSVIDCCDWKDRCGHEDSDDLSRLMDRCWTRSPTKRPDFRELKAVIRRLNNLPCSASEALLEALVGRLEQYASSLESLVEERTADYLEQKRKAEDLLYQLLPK